MNGSSEQFGKIYDQYIEKIYRFVYLKVASKEMAEDITSKVFLKGWESYQTNQNIANIGAFLYKIARNSVIDHYRQKDKKQTISTDSIAQLADTRVNIHDMAVENAQMEAITVAMRGLKKDYQDVLMLHYVEGMPAEEISEVLDKPAGTVRVLMHRGLKSLKDTLSQEG